MRQTTGGQRLAIGWLGLVGLAGLLVPYLPLPFAPAVPDLHHPGTAPAAGWAVGHWLGTDPLGRDVLANLLFGARTVLLVAAPAALLAALLGAALGSVAGLWGRGLRVPRPLVLAGAGLAWWGLAVPPPALGLTGAALAGVWLGIGRARRRRLPTWPLPLDALVLATGASLGAVPRLLLAVAVAARGPLTPVGLLLLLALLSWPGPARLVRAETLRVAALPRVAAARALGLPPGRIWWRHVLPQALRPLRTDLPLSLSHLIGLEATLAFLGLGLPPDAASWGRLLGAARLDPAAWWTAAAPIAALVLTTAALRALAGTPSEPNRQ